MPDPLVYGRSLAMYLRKSRAEENEDTASVLARHRAVLTEYAARGGLTVTRVFEEVVSGDGLFLRPQMLALLRGVEAGEYTGVLCVDIDRLGRGSMQEQGLILDTFKDAGAVIVTPEKVYDLADELDETQTEFKTFFARQELKMIKKRLSRGVRQTVQKGGFVANPPFGYRRVYRERLPTLEPDPREADFVRYIFRRYLAGDGCETIAHSLNAMGAHPRRSDAFTRVSVRYILHNPVYTGKVLWGRTHFLRPRRPGERFRRVRLPAAQWFDVAGRQPAIIDKADFAAAGRLLRTRARPPCRNAEQMENPLAGLLYCRRCGRAMTRRPAPASRKNSPAQLLCPTKGCMRSTKLAAVEDAVLRAVEARLSPLPPEHPDVGGTVPDPAGPLRAELRRLDARRRRLYDYLEQGVYTPEEFQERRELLAQSACAVEAALHRTETAPAAPGKAAPPPVRTLLQEYRACTPAERNALLKSLILKAWYYRPKAGPGDIVLEIELRSGI